LRRGRDVHNQCRDCDIGHIKTVSRLAGRAR
jgi:hypothetical protein